MDALREPLNNRSGSGSQVGADESLRGDDHAVALLEAGGGEGDEGKPEEDLLRDEGDGLEEGDMEKWADIVDETSSYNPFMSLWGAVDGLRGYLAVSSLVLGPLIAVSLGVSSSEVPEGLVLYSFVSFALSGPTIFMLQTVPMYRGFVVRELLKRRVMVSTKYVPPTFILIATLELIIISPLVVAFLLHYEGLLGASTMVSVALQCIPIFISLASKLRDTGAETISYSDIFSDAEKRDVAFRVLRACSHLTIYEFMLIQRKDNFPSIKGERWLWPLHLCCRSQEQEAELPSQAVRIKAYFDRLAKRIRSKDAMVKEELERFQRQEEARNACNICKSGPTGYFSPFVENVSKLGTTWKFWKKQTFPGVIFIWVALFLYVLCFLIFTSYKGPDDCGSFNSCTVCLGASSVCQWCSTTQTCSSSFDGDYSPSKCPGPEAALWTSSNKGLCSAPASEQCGFANTCFNCTSLASCGWCGSSCVPGQDGFPVSSTACAGGMLWQPDECMAL